MIVWINGPFGVGKTSTAEALHKLLPESHLFDPEETGQFLWAMFPPEMQRQGDFQDIPLWRSFNRDLLAYLSEAWQGTLIVPMTLVRPDYVEEIIGGLRNRGIRVEHFVLTASPETICRRLRGRGEPENGWAEQQLPRCLAALAEMPGCRNIDTQALAPQAVAEKIWQEIRHGQPPA